MEQDKTTTSTIGHWVTNSQVPRPVFIFACLILLMAGIKAITGGWVANQPASIATAIGDGLMSVFHDDKGLKNMTLIFTKDGRNNEGSVELRDVGAGLGALIFGGTPRVGGKLYFQNYQHSSGVILNGGPLDIELSNATTETQKAGRYKVQGSVSASGSNQPVYVQLDFISPAETYGVEQLSGNVTINGKTTPIQP
ncbi:hypothetical protein [Fibrella forsythiae]|uniref:Uncharacterized protein n=1 Tax=Fibrella forsythiae TaxID=2817061 RepID=A0ABS3JI26_9BACT|nr:hypothetical protein [Fibrella forsythiae]MBO0949625.1 hypothetical protein [Fibrella forsythiae]